MSDFECWFCKQTIDEYDVKAVAVEISNLWFSGENHPVQTFWAHSKCAEQNLSGGYNFYPDDLINPQ
jgi:hypothetical protein